MAETEELKEIFNNGRMRIQVNANNEIFISHFGRSSTELKIYSNGTGLSFESSKSWHQIQPRAWGGRLTYELKGPDMPPEY